MLQVVIVQYAQTHDCSFEVLSCSFVLRIVLLRNAMVKNLCTNWAFLTCREEKVLMSKKHFKELLRGCCTVQKDPNCRSRMAYAHMAVADSLHVNVTFSCKITHLRQSECS